MTFAKNHGSEAGPNGSPTKSVGDGSISAPISKRDRWPPESSGKIVSAIGGNPVGDQFVKNPTSAIAASGRASGLCLAIAITLSCAGCGQTTDDAKAATDAIRQQIAKYTAALDAADIDLAAQVWRTSTEVSLIHPAGHARGWEEVKALYQFFGSSFSERKLTARDVSVHVDGDTAWAEFYWHFVGKQTKDGSVVQSDGRSTQIYNKAGNRWQLVHEHYSSPVMSP